MSSIFNKVKVILKGEFSRNLMTMISGNALAQLIPVLASIVLARIYSPTEIGAFAFFFTIVNMLSIIASLKYNEAIVLPKADEEGKGLLYLSIFLNLVFSIFVFLIILILKTWIISFIKYPILGNWLYFLPIAIFFTGLFQSFNYWSNREKEYKIIAISRVTQNLVISIVQIVGFSLSVGGLILGRIIGILVSLIQTYKLSTTLNFRNINKKYIVVSFKKYVDFAKYNTPNSFMNQLSNNLPILTFPSSFGMSYAGFYSFSANVILAPMGIITSSMQQVFYQKIASMYANGEDLYSYILKTYKNLFLVGIIPHILIFIFSPAIFSLVFGEKWRIAGEFSRYLVPWFFLVF